MTPALREQARKAVQVITADGRHLSAGRAISSLWSRLIGTRTWFVSRDGAPSSGRLSLGTGSSRATGHFSGASCFVPSKRMRASRRFWADSVYDQSIVWSGCPSFH